MKVIVLQQQHLAFEFGQPSNAIDFTDDVLARDIRGVRLAGKQKQHRLALIPEDRAHPIEITEEQRRALVGREPARKSYRQHVWVDRIGIAQQPVQMSLRATITEMLMGYSMAHYVQHLRLERLPYAPEQMVRDSSQAFAEVLVAHAARPVQTKEFVKLVGPFRCEESRHMYAVSDVRQRVFFRFEFGPQRRTDT